MEASMKGNGLMIFKTGKVARKQRMILVILGTTPKVSSAEKVRLSGTLAPPMMEK